MTMTLSNAFTVDDLEAVPDAGTRYELIGGAIVMTPAPEPVHQRVGQRPVRLVDGTYEPYADSDGPVALDRPVPVSCPLADLARPRGR